MNKEELDEGIIEIKLEETLISLDDFLAVVSGYCLVVKYASLYIVRSNISIVEPKSGTRAKG